MDNITTNNTSIFTHNLFEGFTNDTPVPGTSEILPESLELKSMDTSKLPPNFDSPFYLEISKNTPIDKRQISYISTYLDRIKDSPTNIQNTDADTNISTIDTSTSHNYIQQPRQQQQQHKRPSQPQRPAPLQIAVIVAGCRDYDDKVNISMHMSSLLNIIASKTDISNIRIVEGEARGADSISRMVGEFFQIQVKKFPADWQRFGKRAGFYRNEQMAKFASKYNGFLMAFWDGKSKGTKSMISLGKKYNLCTIVVRIDDDGF